MTNLTRERPNERQEKWKPIEGIITPAARAVIDEDQSGLVVTLMFSEIVDGLQSDLRITFGRVPAYSVYEEFVHPWGDGTAPPKLSGNWESYVYPLLRIEDSQWMNLLAEQLIAHPDSIHYRLLTLDQIVDVLCSKPPVVSWVNGVES